MKNNQILIIFIILFFSVLLFLFDIYDGISIYDEGIILTGASQVLHGSIPYKDFWTMYGPAQFYLVAGWMYIFGENVISPRIMSLIIMISTALIFSIFLKKIKCGFQVLPIITFLIFSCAYRLFDRSVSSAFFLVILGLYIFYKSIELKEKKYYLMLGLICGFIIFFRQDLGLFSFVGFVISYLVLYLKNKNLLNNKILISYYLIGFFIVIISIGLYFLSHVSFEDLYTQLYFIPTKIFPDYRGISYPIPELVFINNSIDLRLTFFPIWFSVTFWGSVLILIIEIIILIKYFLINKIEEINIYKLIIIILTIGGFVYSSVRTDKTHIYIMNILIFVLLGFEWEKIRKNIILKYMCISFISLVLIYPIGLKINFILKSINNSNPVLLDSPRAKGIKLKPELDYYNDLLKFIDSSTSINETIFSANYTHERIYLNDVIIYFLTNRKPASSYTELHPGVVTTEDVQLEIINSLKINNTRIIIRMLTDTANEDNKSRIPSGVKTLDNYIDSNYIIIRNFVGYQVLEIK